MIGSRCLGAGGSATRVKAARAPSIQAACTSLPPLAECSYRTWQPPQPDLPPHRKQARAKAGQGLRWFSSSPLSFRDDSHPPTATASVNHHGFESFLHEPPHAYAKVKRLRPVQNSSLTATDPEPISTHNQSDSVLHDSPSASHPTPADNHTHTFPPPHPPEDVHASQLATTKFKTSRSRSDDVSPDLLLKNLKTPIKATGGFRKSRLPPGFQKIDAYLRLRESDPQSLASLSYDDILRLVNRAATDKLGGVFELLLQDIVGPDMSRSKSKPGYFQIYAGTEKRYKLLRAILRRGTSSDLLLHDATAMNVFMLMLDDLIQVRKSMPQGTNAADAPAPTVVDASDFTLPSDLPVGEMRGHVNLAVSLHNPELAPILNALRKHLEAHTPDFPSAREGAKLIAYYLQPNLREFGAALDVVRALRDTNALAQEVVDDAIQDGKKHLAALEAMLSSADTEAEDGNNRPSAVELQQICVDVSLRLVAMKCLLAQRPKGGVQYRKTLESLVASFRSDLVDLYWNKQAPSIPDLLDVPFRNIRSVFLHLVGQNEESCLAEALFVLQRCDQRLVAMLPAADLQEYCDVARRNDVLRLSAETYALVLRAKTASTSISSLPIDCKHVLVRDGMMINTDTFLALLRHLISQGQKIMVHALFRLLRLLPLTDVSTAQLSMRFATAQRARLIALLAEAGLTEEAFELFQHWSHCRYDADADSDKALTSAESLRNAGSVRLADPLIERQIRLMHDSDRHVAISTDCLVALVRNICRQSTSPDVRSQTHGKQASTTTSDQLKRARFVISVFTDSCTPMDWNHYRLTALAWACFIAKDVSGAFDALAKISFLREIPDQVDIAVLLGGLIEHDADRAVDLFIRHCTVPETIVAKDKGAEGRKIRKGRSDSVAEQAEVDSKGSLALAPMKPSLGLTSMLINRSIAKGRMDLVDRLYAFSEAVGVSSLLGEATALRAVFSPGVTPSKVTRTIDKMLQNGWEADPGLLENLAQRLLIRSMERLTPQAGSKPTSIDAKQATRRPLPSKERVQHAQAAVYLMQVSARTKEVVNLSTVSRALTSIIRGKTFSPSTSLAETKPSSSDASVTRSHPVRRRGRQEDRQRWIPLLDSIVSLLRWTRFFDTGDDYRRSLPLWKLSNGELVTAELDEILDTGFRGGLSRRKFRQRTSATAATLPTMADTDGVVQQHSAHSASLPNVLPAELFRRLIEAYLSLADVEGAAEIASWMRDEANVAAGKTPQEAEDFVDRVKAAVLRIEARKADGQGGAKESFSEEAPGVSDILRMLAGQQSTARTKRWWTP